MLKAIVIFLLFLCAQVLSSVITLLWDNSDFLFQGGSLGSLSLSSFTPTGIGLGLWIANLFIFFVLWRLRLTSKHLLGKFAKGIPTGGGMAVISFIFIGFGLSFLLEPLHLEDGQMMRLFEKMQGNIIAVSAVCVIGPFLEEVIFRDGIQRHLMRSGLSPWLAIPTSSAVFAIVHMNAAQAVPAFLLGILLGLLYHKTGDLRLCLPAHIINNSLGMLLFHLPEMQETMSGFSLWFSLTVGFLFLLGGGAAFYRSIQK